MFRVSTVDRATVVGVPQDDADRHYRSWSRYSIADSTWWTLETAWKYLAQLRELTTLHSLLLLKRDPKLDLVSWSFGWTLLGTGRTTSARASSLDYITTLGPNCLIQHGLEATGSTAPWKVHWTRNVVVLAAVRRSFFRECSALCLGACRGLVN